MKRERVVLDTNVLISGLFSSTSTPAQAVQHAIEHGQVLASSATLGELMTKLLSAKFDPYVTREHRDALLLRLAPLIEIVEVVQTVRVSRDSTDDNSRCCRSSPRAGHFTQTLVSTRLRWTFLPVAELFVVYNHNVRSILDRWQLDSNQLVMKVQYAWRM